jgi:hypothetical protein
MVRDHAWRRTMPRARGILCLACLAQWLGRPLTAADFQSTPPPRSAGLF